MSRTIRRLDFAEIALLLDWAGAEGWNPGLGDAAAFQAADPNGFFGAFVDGRMVAGISAVAYDEHFGFIGLYICHPDWRGQGHGKAVWDAGMAYLGSRTIGLDGVPEQQANYAKMGFVPVYETIRMSGTLAPRDNAEAAFVHLDAIRRFDRQCFPAGRDGFLRHWLADPNRSVAHFTSGGVDGYAVMRQCREGSKIGPLFAADLQVAVDLISSFSGRVDIDVPAAQGEWLSVLANLGFEPGFRTARMYRGPVPAVRPEGVFGVSSLELG
jgi:GNAT superfamily N-acetyltransferase